MAGAVGPQGSIERETVEGVATAIAPTVRRITDIDVEFNEEIIKGQIKELPNV